MSRVFSNNKIFNRFLSTGGAGIEKTNFENENVANINVSRSVSLNGTKVSGDVGARGSITAANATVQGEINAGGSITAINSIAEELNAGGSVTAVSVKVFSKVNAGGSVTANRCDQLGKVKAGGSAEIDECPLVTSISVGGHITLQASKVTGDVFAGSQATVNNSTIGGKLTCSADRMIIEGSMIDTIELRYPTSVFVSMGEGSSRVEFSNISINGGADVIINGISLIEMMKAKAAESTTAECGPKQILELRKCTVKDVIFEGGNGEVILSLGSVLSGSVTGGIVKT